MGIVSTIPEKCRRCYACVRECPAKAIKVIAGQATVIAEQCVACGNCVKVCTQKAKRIEDATVLVRRLLEGGDTVVALLAPSFPAAFDGVSPGRVVGALRRLGFSQVWEVAFGAELISRPYAELARQAIRGGDTVISTPCPAIVSYVQKYLPQLRPALARVVSPMIATARAVRSRLGAGVRVVFIGPCIAKKAEIKDPEVQGAVDAALTFEELLALFSAAEITPAAEKPSVFDGPSAYLGRSIPISGGLLRTAGIDSDILQNTVLVTEGKDRVMTAFRELADGKSKARVLDVLFCEGCINGPKMVKGLSVFARKDILTDHIREMNSRAAPHDLQEAPGGFDEIDLARGFRDDAVVLPQPTEEEISRALRCMRKFSPADQLNCGSCGYSSCRDKAVAVCQGLAEVSMCLPYLVEELEGTLSSLQRSHQVTQDKLVQTERLASMGQISAGVAHEINNPLSTILLYSHMLLKAHREGDAESEDIQMIVSEANRCRTIMRGLLDFARQTRVVKAATDLGALIEDVAAAANLRIREAGGAAAGGAPAPIQVRTEVAAGLPSLLLDAQQIRQMLVNLVQNGIDAVESRLAAAAPGHSPGEVCVGAALSLKKDHVHLTVRDNGTGMPPEVVREIFTPFYTTKELGKGTGMGLSIVYGVVKMHAGDISVESEPGQGTTFLVRLPAECTPPREEPHERVMDRAAG